jgi:ribosome-associated translation inhibitor RaiA
MQQAPQITFRNMEPSDTAQAQIVKRIDDLDQMFDRITSCTVVVEVGHRHQHQGRLFHVHINLVVPGKTIVVGRNPGEHHAHEDLHVVIRDAFDAARRQLQDHIRHLRDGQTLTASQL